MKENNNFKLKSICHSCVSENPAENKALYTAGSSGRADACPRMTGEQGRSMVEMLGVLAVIGVLSVAGIAGYNNAMNKHRANELLNEASKRAAIVAMQAAAGQNLNLGEFSGQPNADLFTSVVENPNNNNQFQLTISSVDEDICKQMVNAVGTGSQIRKITSEGTDATGNATNCSDGAIVLTFNKDLSSTVWASDYKTKSACETAGKTWCGGSDSCSEVECCADKTVGQCQECNAGAVLESAAEGTTCDYSTEGDGVCHNGNCVQKSTEDNCVAGGVRCNDTTYGECCPTGYFCTTNGDAPGVCKKFTSGCTTNDDCTGSNQYCKISANNCTTITSGTCTALGTPESVSIAGLGNVIVSPTSMNWWSAKNWCEAQGKHLINVENFQAYRSGETNQIVSNTTGVAGCAKGKRCGDWSNNGMWKGTSGTDARTLTSEGEALQANYSPVVLALAKVFKGRKNYFWTASDYNNSSCLAFSVIVRIGYVTNDVRDTSDYALCE